MAMYVKAGNSDSKTGDSKGEECEPFEELYPW